jgi:hypothetical protein
MLHSVENLHGFAVEGTDGQIGQIRDAYFDDRAWAIRFLVVETGPWLEGRKVLISPLAIGEIDWTRQVLAASITREQVRRSPDIDTRKPVSRQHEVEQYGYYGYPYYWGGSGLWGDGMRPDRMLATYRGAASQEAAQNESSFVDSQAELHRQRGDDPHLRSFRAMERYHIHATDGEIGHLDGMLFDDESWAIRYVVVNTSDWWLGHKVLVAPTWIADISWLEATVSVDLTRQAVKHAPAYDPDSLPDREQETQLHEHHGRPGYWPAGKAREHGPGPAHPGPRGDADRPREKAEESEVAGRHKNSGQKDHKGAR